jgi:hypothetical protein
MSDLSSNNLNKPKRMRAGDKEVDQHSLKDQIELDRHLAANQAVTPANRMGLMISKLRPPGSI